MGRSALDSAVAEPSQCVDEMQEFWHW